MVNATSRTATVVWIVQTAELTLQGPGGAKALTSPSPHVETRTRHDVHRSVMEAIGKLETPDFVLHTGDLVADGNDSSLWPVFFDIERDVLRHTAFFPSLGNHERNADYFRKIFQEDKPHYSFNWGNGHFIVMNSDIANAAICKRTRRRTTGS